MTTHDGDAERAIKSKGQWPSLPVAEWHAMRDTLQLWAQRLARYGWPTKLP
jgi:hypothetical protein